MSILAEILDAKRAEVARAAHARPRATLERAAAAMSAPRGFKEALRRPPGAPLRAIAEIKRASPSAGAIRPDADPAVIAREYDAAGAAALSILTDERFFDGRLEFLAAAREVVELPLLRKDFLFDPYQVVEARAAGADAVLIIVAAVDDVTLDALLAEARAHGMDALVEVHDAGEAARAVAAGAEVIGVNHRDLASFEIDMGLTARLRPAIPESCVLVAESGIKTAGDLAALAHAGADAVLVGSSLMAAPSPGEALKELLG